MRVGLAIGLGAFLAASAAGAKGSDHKYKGKPVPPKQACEKVCGYTRKQCEQDCKDENPKDAKAEKKCLAECPQQVKDCEADCEKNMAKRPEDVRPPQVEIPQMPVGEPKLPENVPPASGDAQ